MKLRHFTALITRPENLAHNLAKKISEQGGHSLIFPTVSIGLENSAQLYVVLAQLAQYDLVIFVSQNAVLQTKDFIQQRWLTWPDQTRLAATGLATANLLQKTYQRPVIFPRAPYNSERLLDLLMQSSLCGRRVLIIQGDTSLNVLEKGLMDAGVHVQSTIAYRRTCPSPENSLIQRIINTKIDVIICTSGIGVYHLTILLKHPRLFSMQLLVASERIANLCRDLGFTKRTLIADNATDDALLDTAIKWWEENHGT